jgi:hypothetical protein
VEDRKMQVLGDLLLTISEVVYKEANLSDLYRNSDADDLVMCMIAMLKMNENKLEEYENLNLVLKSYEYDFGKHSLDYDNPQSIGIKIREDNEGDVFILAQDLDEIAHEFKDKRNELSSKERDIVQNITKEMVGRVLNYDMDIDSSLLSTRYKKCRTEEERTNVIIADGVGGYHDIFNLCLQAIHDPEFKDYEGEEYKKHSLKIDCSLFDIDGLGGLSKNEQLWVNIEDFDIENKSANRGAFRKIFDKTKECDLSLEF